MQIFLPSTDFVTTASVLDNKRLNKQALEAWQIMMTNLRLDPAGLYRDPKGWVNHPAVKMWAGHEAALLEYIACMVREWLARGYRSTILGKALNTYRRAHELGLPIGTGLPAWFDEYGEAVAATHRVALLCKNYSWYSQFGWVEDTGSAPAGYEYLWCDSPTK